MKISILGAGIGGLTTAILLKKHNIDVTLYERSKAPKTIGSGIVLWPNAIKALAKTEILHELYISSTKLQAMTIYDNSGESLRNINLKKLEKSMEGYPAYPMLRHDLHSQLTNLAKKLGVPIHYDHAVTSINDNKAGKASVTFDRGSKVVADLIIGADGRMKSISRKYVTGNNTPTYQGYVNWVGILPEINGHNAFKATIHDYWGSGERFGFVPLTPNSAYWAGCKVLPEGLGKSTDNNKQILLDLFESWPAIIKKVIDGTPKQHIKRIDVYDLEPIDVWHKNNVVLLGDSAHAAGPTSGQGACQAIEDAVCLSELLITSSSIEMALSSYQAVRVPKTTKIIHNARDRVARIFETDEHKCKERNKQTKLMHEKDAIMNMAKLWGNKNQVA